MVWILFIGDFESSADSPRGWKSMEEPDFEYDDETGLDLEAQDGKYNHKKLYK